MPAPRRSLRRTLAGRVVMIAIVAVLLQLAYTIYDYRKSPGDLAEATMEQDLDALAAAIPHGAGSFVIPEDLAVRFTAFPQNYGFDIRRASGEVLASANAPLLGDFDLGADTKAREVIVRDRPMDKSRTMGGRAVTVSGVEYLMRVAAVDDPAGLQTKVLIGEVIDRVTLPIVPLTLFLFAVLWLALDRSLAPVEATARAVRDVDLAKGSVRLDLSGVPAEIAVLGETVNDLLDRLDEVIKAHHDFAANVAHELRTPLSLILLDLEHSKEASSRHALAEVQSMTRLVDQLLSISRLEGLGASTFAHVDLSAVARSVAVRLAPGALEWGVDLGVVAPDTVVVMGRAEVIDSALRNLVENAVRVSPHGAGVEILVGPGPAVSVQDHGPGIAGEQLATLFERHRQGDRRTRGAAGLGLEITKRSIELHGGRIEVTSALGHGSTFTLIFPDTQAVDTAVRK